MAETSLLMSSPLRSRAVFGADLSAPPARDAATHCRWPASEEISHRLSQARVKNRDLGSTQRIGCCCCCKHGRNQHWVQQVIGDARANSTQGRMGRFSRFIDSGSMKGKQTECNAPMRVSCREVAPASNVAHPNGLAFLRSAGFQGVAINKPGPESWPGLAEGYSCCEVSDEDFPDRLSEPPLLSIGEANGVSFQSSPGACLGNARLAGGGGGARSKQAGENEDRFGESAAERDILDADRSSFGGTAAAIGSTLNGRDSRKGSSQLNGECQKIDGLSPVNRPDPDTLPTDPPFSTPFQAGSGRSMGFSVDMERLNLVLSALVQKGQAEELVEYLESLEELEVDLGSVGKAEGMIDMLAQKGTVKLALRCLRVFPQSGALYSHAMRAFPPSNASLFWKSLVERIKHEGDMAPPRNYHLVAKALLRGKSAEFVDFVCAFKDVSGCSTRDFCSNEVLFRELARGRDVASTLKYLHHGVRPTRLGTEYAKAIAQFSRQRAVDAARAIFDDLAASRPEQIDTFACRALIDAYKDAKLPQEALRAFERMPQWGVKPNKHIYHSLLHSFVLERNSRSELLGSRETVLRTCLRLFKQMKGEEIEPDSVTYTILMTIFGAAAQPELAWGVYQELRQKAQEGGGAVVLTQRQYGAILSVLVEGREVEKAFEVKDDMEAAGIGLDRISWCLLIRACTQVDQVYRAFTVFDEMVRSGCPASTEAYNVLINTCATAGLEDRAWNLLDEMKAGGSNAKSEGLGVSGSEATSDGDRSNGADTERTRGAGVFREGSSVSRAEPSLAGDQSNGAENGGNRGARDFGNVSGFGREGLTSDGDRSNGAEVGRIRGAGASVGGMVGRGRERGTTCAPDIVTYNTMLKVCYDQPERAHKILEEIADEGLRPNIRTFNSLIDIYARKADAPGARQVYGQMKAAGLQPNVVTYTSLMDAMMKSGDIDSAMGLLEEMKAAGVRPNKATYSVLLRVRPEWKPHYDVQRGLRLYEEMRGAGFAPNDSDFKDLMGRWAEEQMAAKAREGERSRLASPGAEKAKPKAEAAAAAARPPMFVDLVMRKGSSESAETEELTIDLHGLSRPEARAAVLSLLRSLQLRHAQGWKVQSDLTIITGRGIGSRITGIPVVRNAVLKLLKEELGFPVIAWDPSPELDDLNLETLNLRSIGARALVPETMGSKNENGVAPGKRKQAGNNPPRDSNFDLDGNGVASSNGNGSEAGVSARNLEGAAKRDPARELMAEAITAIAGHNEVEVNSLLVHGLGKPGVLKPIPEDGGAQLNGEAALEAKAELTDALLRTADRAGELEPLDEAEDASERLEDDTEYSGAERFNSAVDETSASGDLNGSNRYARAGAWGQRDWRSGETSEDEYSDAEEEGTSERSGSEWDSDYVPESFKRMPPKLRERQLQRLKDAERWRQLEEELYYLGPYGQRLLYTRRRLKNQGRIVVPKEALLEWVAGKRQHGRQRRKRSAAGAQVT